MVAIFVIIVGVVGVYSLLRQTIASIRVASSKLTASYLAQEGVEVVRNIRDSNWIKQNTVPGTLWDDGILSGDWEADYQARGLVSGYSGSFLKIDTDGYYSYATGVNSKYQRKINIEKTGDYLVKVTVTVYWQEKGVNNSIIVQENLYDWKSRL
jgi:Tfp pilus assembly protein PilV